ncbi:DUF2254 domain-containing protein [Desertibaculum subflavum]|uniref:DUF2254 domain-containing protein n=1 Tax=Desertibaculum subflavum TaxID=2268458 RepID=UPI0034D29772
MQSRWHWIVARLGRRLWVKVSLYVVLAIAAALCTPLVAPYLPPGLGTYLGADSLDDVLKILASSMLVVATFSISGMLAAFGSIVSTASPRAARLLIEDSKAQNALGTFVGSFLFGLVAIMALSADYYSNDGKLLLFAITIVVVVLIVGTLLNWIDLLSRLGQIRTAIDFVADRAIETARMRRDDPFLGGQPFAGEVMLDYPIRAKRIGYVQHIDMAALQAVAERLGGEMQVAVLPGALVDPTQPLAWLVRAPSEEEAEHVRAAFGIDRQRSFDQDPRFGLIVLSEIGCKALSPGINDPGTAIAVIGALMRALGVWTERGEEAEPRCPRVQVPSISAEDLFDDAFLGLGTYGAAHLAVGIRLQKALVSLARTGDAGFVRAAQHQSALALKRARQALTIEEDIARLESAAKQVATGRAA